MSNTKLKVSELLLAGMKQVKGQATGIFYDENTDTACALGCVYIGLGIPKDVNKIEEFNRWIDMPVMSGLDEGVAISQALDNYESVYGYSIADDNDDSVYTLEQIVERLKAIGE